MTRRPNPLESLHAAHAALDSLRVNHGLIGGWAVIAWGRVRATRDVDWIADIPASRKKEVLAALAALGSVEWRNPGEDDPMADRAAISRCVEIELGKGRIPTIRPEDIIAMKLQAGGGLDYEDARALLQIQDQRLDEALLMDACKARHVLDRLALLRR
jgi:hypothetical protein